MKKNKNNPKIIFRIPNAIHLEMLNDLRRKHPHAWERMGFLHTRLKWLDKMTVLIIANFYQVLEDEDYIRDSSVGAKIGASAIRKAMQYMIENRTGGFHVHLHDHRGRPGPSPVDDRGIPGIIESLSHVTKEQATGMLILSSDGFFDAIRIPGIQRKLRADSISIVGFPMQFNFDDSGSMKASNVFTRQSFLGPHSQNNFDRVRVGIIGYGGGGSHVGQQLAHIGVKNITVFDDDIIEDSNLNRLVGGQWKDVINKLAKTSIAKRVIRSILPASNITIVTTRWQEAPEKLQQCDIVIGCGDTYAERQQAEVECRRYLIPYVDIGMDVYKCDNAFHSISGQIMVSMPGTPCFWCNGFLTEEKLGLEAAKYGNTGGRPQVVWPNGVLASTAVGIIVELITGWTGRKDQAIYLEYDGSTGHIKDHIRLLYSDEICKHYPLKNCGPARFTQL